LKTFLSSRARPGNPTRSVSPPRPTCQAPPLSPQSHVSGHHPIFHQSPSMPRSAVGACRESRRAAPHPKKLPQRSPNGCSSTIPVHAWLLTPTHPLLRWPIFAATATIIGHCCGTDRPCPLDNRQGQNPPPPHGPQGHPPVLALS
jgi:hypothetical protein